MDRKLAVFTLIVGVALLASSGGAQAPAEKPQPAPLSVLEGLQPNLARRVGAKVELVLTSGQSLTGTVTAVGAATVHLGALEGREFYDALIRVDQIAAVVVRAR